MCIHFTSFYYIRISKRNWTDASNGRSCHTYPQLMAVSNIVVSFLAAQKARRLFNIFLESDFWCEGVWSMGPDTCSTYFKTSCHLGSLIPWRGPGMVLCIVLSKWVEVAATETGQDLMNEGFFLVFLSVEILWEKTEDLGSACKCPNHHRNKAAQQQKAVVSSCKKQPNLKARLSVQTLWDLASYHILSMHRVDSAQPAFASTERLMNIKAL